MGMPELEQALDAMRASGQTHVKGRRDPALVAAAERALGLTFPPTYRRFVLDMGAGGVGAFEVYGVTGDDFTNSSVPNGIWVTLSDRAAGMPGHLVVVGETGMGENYVLDTSRTDATGECPVVIWVPGASQPGDELEHVADDFGTFLWDNVQGELDQTWN
jgi:hypothetical protein